MYGSSFNMVTFRPLGAVRYHRPTRLLLQAVITNRRGCPQSLFQISRVKQAALRIRCVTPKSSETIGLQLLPD